MKKQAGIWIFLALLSSLSGQGQDARIYFEGTYYNGPYRDLNLGQTVFVNSDGDAISIRIFNPNVALKVTKVDGNFNPLPIPAYYFIYTDRDFPEVFGTDQYSDINLRVECIPRANTWRELPQPQIYVPFDITNSNPHPENDAYLKPFVAGHRMLVLRRAFIWENSEAIGGLHGPYGDVKIEVYPPGLLSYSEEYLAANWPALSPGNILSGSDLPGPIWSGYAPIFYPDPYDEWVDGPFGCLYSNIAVWDWDAPGAVQSIGICIAEADSPNAFMGKSQFAITPGMEGEILVKVWGFGFVVLENILVPDSGQEPSVAKGDVYWYGGWNGQYPVSVYGPQNPAVPCETCPGNQFRPFTNDQFWNFHNNPAFDGYTVGLLGRRFPAGVYDRPRTYCAIDGPVVFGQE